MPKFAPATRAEMPASLEDVKRNVQAIINAAEAALKELTTLSRDGVLMANPTTHHLVARVAVVLRDATVALAHALSE